MSTAYESRDRMTNSIPEPLPEPTLQEQLRAIDLALQLDITTEKRNELLGERLKLLSQITRRRR